MLQRFYLWVHHRTYRRRKVRQRRFAGIYVVSIGNLSAGGTGKTPAVRLLAAAARAPMVVLRGYGGSLSGRGALIGDGTTLYEDWRGSGDEAALLAGGGLRVAVGRNRADVIERFVGASRTVLLDDAFQNPSVYRDHELVLIDASAPVRSMQPLPSGRFRDDWSALERANTVLLTRCSDASSQQLSDLMNVILEYLPAAHVFQSDHLPGDLVPALPSQPSSESVSAPALGAFCGIGNPDSFFRTLQSLGLEISERMVFADHHHYTKSDLAELLERSRRGGLRWITTQKDAVRLQASDPLSKQLRDVLHVLPIELRIRAGREKQFLRRVLGPAYVSHQGL